RRGACPLATLAVAGSPACIFPSVRAYGRLLANQAVPSTTKRTGWQLAIRFQIPCFNSLELVPRRHYKSVPLVVSYVHKAISSEITYSVLFPLKQVTAL